MNNFGEGEGVSMDVPSRDRRDGGASANDSSKSRNDDVDVSMVIKELK